jgi:hypothetical protein
MSTELDALMLANALEVSDKHPELINVNNRAAAKLRRLHAVNEELLEALEEYVNADPVDDTLNPRKRKARAAIAAYQAKQRGEA